MTSLLLLGFIGVFFIGVLVGAMIRSAFLVDLEDDPDVNAKEEVVHPNAWDILDYRETDKERRERILNNRDDL